MWPEWPGARGVKPAPDLGEFLRSFRAAKGVEEMAKYIRADEMAGVLSVTIERLSLLVAQGCPQNGRDKFNPDEVIHWYLAHTRQTIFENAKKSASLSGNECRNQSRTRSSRSPR